MYNAQSLRDLSRRCRNLAKTAISPAVIDQLRRWAVELAERADEVDREEFGQREEGGGRPPVHAGGEPRRERRLIHTKGDRPTGPALDSARSTRRTKRE